MRGMQLRRDRSYLISVAVLVALVGATGCMADSVDGQRSELTAACIDDPADLPEGAWLCPANVAVECENGVGNDDTIFAVPPQDEGLLCENVDVQVSDPGPFPVGTTEVAVTATAHDTGETVELCRAHITVVDTLPPEVVPLDPGSMWPPNHGMQMVSVADCAQVDDLCDSHVDMRFTSVTSDEPADTTGDGSTAPDIEKVNCGTVSLRAERMGDGNGRVYTLGWEATDDAGHLVTGRCTVGVPHDQSGAPAVADGPAYEVPICP